MLAKSQTYFRYDVALIGDTVFTEFEFDKDCSWILQAKFTSLTGTSGSLDAFICSKETDCLWTPLSNYGLPYTILTTSETYAIPDDHWGGKKFAFRLIKDGLTGGIIELWFTYNLR